MTSVAMESTGVYWIPVYEILEQRGFDVILVNARYAKNVPGRKTDVSDATWLRQLHSFGLLRGSFRSDAEIAVRRLAQESGGPTARWCGHPFDRSCRDHGIEHRLAKPNHPWTNGQVNG